MTGSDDLRAVLFDAAGTLIELSEPVGETYSRLARDFGVDLPAWRVEDAFARILSQAPPRVLGGLPLDEIERREREWWRDVVRSTFLATDSSARFSDFEGYFDALYARFSEPSSWRCRPGCISALRALRDHGLALGVVSNFDRRLPGLLAGLELAPLLDVVVLPSDAGAEKPDPRIFALALRQLGITAEQAVFVGNSHSHDLAGARSAGMRAIDVGSLATLSELPQCLVAGTQPIQQSSRSPHE
jgi:putative hydrolase of the HAD superfamily